MATKTFTVPSGPEGPSGPPGPEGPSGPPGQTGATGSGVIFLETAEDPPVGYVGLIARPVV